MMTKSVLRRMLPVADWPEIDMRLWVAAQSGSYTMTLCSPTIAMTIRGYGRWLSVLAAQGCLDTALHPADRVTPVAVLAYVDRLRDIGNTQSTIDGRLDQLARAMRIMAPQRSFTWLNAKRFQGEAHLEHCVKPSKNHLEGWPDIDRQIWQAAFTAGDILEGPYYAASLRPATVRTARESYKRWLKFLLTTGRLDPLASPMARVTRHAVTAYVLQMHDTHCNAALITQLSALRTALRILHPDADFRWLTAPGGQSLASLLPVSKKPIQVISSRILYKWGRLLMRDALAEAHPEQRRLTFRDGLLIALFAARAPRVRSIASLCLGKTVVKIGGTYRLVFEPDDVKTGRRIEYDAPAGLSAALDRYIAVERMELLAGKSHQAFWLDKYGEPLKVPRISQMIRCRSKQRFGKEFGPHRFRHAMGTMAPLLDPAHPGVAAAILGISGRMVERHYNRASQADVAYRFHTTLREQRTSLQSLAWREFERIVRNDRQVSRRLG